MNKNIINNIYDVYSKIIWLDKIKEVHCEYKNRVRCYYCDDNYMNNMNINVNYAQSGKCKKCKNMIKDIYLFIGYDWCNIMNRYIHNIQLCDECDI